MKIPNSKIWNFLYEIIFLEFGALNFGIYFLSYAS